MWRGGNTSAQAAALALIRPPRYAAGAMVASDLGMSIWGRLMEGAAGLLAGTPLGALLGLGGRGDATRSTAFTIGVVVLSAKMARVDGVVRRVEVETFKRLFRVEPEEMRNVGYVYDLARRDSAGFEVYARQIAALFAERDPVLEELLDSLLLIAESDGELHAAEVAFLRAVAGIFGFSDADFDRMVEGRRLTLGDPFCDPYRVLGVPCGAAPETVKDAYRRLAREHHPDRLIAQGLPAEFVDLATEKMAAINAAYDGIRRGWGEGAG